MIKMTSTSKQTLQNQLSQQVNDKVSTREVMSMKGIGGKF